MTTPTPRDAAQDLPALPEPHGAIIGYTAISSLNGDPIAEVRAKRRDGYGTPLYTADQMRAYARAALAAQPVAPFLFIAMDDDKRAHLTWCANEDEVHAAVSVSMFWLQPGENMSADHAEQLAANVAELLDSGALTFEGDPPLYLYRVAGSSPVAQTAADLEREREARKAAQTENEALKERLARARLDLMRELREQGWMPPAAHAQQPAALTDAQPENARPFSSRTLTDAKRWRWLRERLLAGDFDYGGEGINALAFEMPAGFTISADADAVIDDAMRLDRAATQAPTTDTEGQR